MKRFVELCNKSNQSFHVNRITELEKLSASCTYAYHTLNILMKREDRKFKVYF